MKRTARLFALLALITTLTGCGSDGAGPGVARGTLVGRIDILLDEGGREIEDRSGVTVTIDGTTHSAVSAADGMWTITDLPPGTYDLTFSKPGFGMVKHFSFPFVGNGRAYFNPLAMPLNNLRLGQIPTFAITHITAVLSPDPPPPEEQRTIDVSGTISSTAPYSRRIQFYASRTPDVSSLNAPFAEEGQIEPGSSTFHYGLNISVIKQRMKLTSGEQIYLVAYGANNGGYPEPFTDRWINTTLTEPSTVVSFVMP